MYNTLSDRKGWTYEQIAEMTAAQQDAAISNQESTGRGDGDILSFATMDEFRRWQTSQKG